MKKKTGGGRPPKFNEDRRPITVTLPKRTLAQLAQLDEDRAKAIVKCVDSVTGTGRIGEKQVEMVKVAEDSALIVVGPSRSLQSVPWLKLVEITPNRYLLCIPTGTAVESLEVAIIDLIENLPANEISEKTLLTDLREQLSHQRRKDNVSKGEILFLDIG